MMKKDSNQRDNQQNRSAARRGFAGMDPDKQNKIASKGGKAAHAQGVAHEWDSAEAQDAGRLGGQS